MSTQLVTIDKEEVERFSALSDEWWKKGGAFAALHRMTPTRMEFILEALKEHSEHKAANAKTFEKLSILDVGCGGGLLSEPLARLGAKVTGIDASEKAIQAANYHSRISELRINYLTGDIGVLIERKKKFNVVIASEVIEHVLNPKEFLKGVAKVLMPNGVLIVTTLNRSIKSLLVAKLGAEYIIKLIPSGTHQWGKFMRPDELEELLRKTGLKVDLRKGISYKIGRDCFVLNNNLSMNYAVKATFLDD
jgi:2-polyprenyl-6-hydroxyphenyl methylase/3-demethylubiquinone-9 3-methyltransferase